MPRLLLVDDNPSIHRIAESLLAPTDVELVCVDSAAEALDRLERGERFDVALVDTAMPGMDGWTLLTRLRSLEATATMPIALMAGVLDPVDPAKLAKAPVQGFLKKPIELRELGDRVKALLATPVAVSPSPFSTVPATPARDLVARAERALPELRPETDVAGTGLEDAELELPEPDLAGPMADADLLVLTAEDLWPEEALAAAPVEAPEVNLELEELDLDILHDLGAEAEAPVAAVDVPPAPVSAPLDGPEADDFADQLVTLSGLEELESLQSDFDFPSPSPAPAAAPEDFGHLEDAATVLGIGAAAEAAAFMSEPEFDAPPAPVPMPAPQAVVPVVPEGPPAGSQPAASGQGTDLAGQAPEPAGGAPAGDPARAVVQALLADPVLVDALVKAVVARMGDQVLREIAWEVMPDLAGRLQR